MKGWQPIYRQMDLTKENNAYSGEIKEKKKNQTNAMTRRRWRKKQSVVVKLRVQGVVERKS